MSDNDYLDQIKALEAKVRMLMNELYNCRSKLFEEIHPMVEALIEIRQLQDHIANLGDEIAELKAKLAGMNEEALEEIMVLKARLANCARWATPPIIFHEEALRKIRKEASQ